LLAPVLKTTILGLKPGFWHLDEIEHECFAVFDLGTLFWTAPTFCLVSWLAAGFKMTVKNSFFKNEFFFTLVGALWVAEF
jgi:hypothetical protein